jgi:putative ABC transport system ATP-binding protein
MEVSIMIQFKNVSKIYRSGANDYPALCNVSFNIEKGEYVLITGKSGSGKSTLLNVLTGVDGATSGDVMVNSTNILRLNEAELTKWRGENVGIVFQFFQLIPTLSVLENILLPMDLIDKIPKHLRIKKAEELLNMVGLSGHEEKMPSALSGGEQQRVAIARSLANDVDIIVADEPTGNLDSKNAEMVFDILDKLKNAGKTVIVVTHERDVIKGASRKIFIKDGAIQEDYPLKEACYND